MGSNKAEANTLAKEVKEFIINQGVDLVGIASAKNLNKEVPRGHRPVDFLPGAKAAVIMGIHMLDTLFHELPARTDIWSDIFMYAMGLVRSLEWKLTKLLESKRPSAINIILCSLAIDSIKSQGSTGGVVFASRTAP